MPAQCVEQWSSQCVEKALRNARAMRKIRIARALRIRMGGVRRNPMMNYDVSGRSP